MRLSAPKKNTFWIATVLAVLGVVGNFVSLPVVSQFAFWLVVIGFVVLWFGNTQTGF